jgi:hypothetical protein
MQQAQQQQRQKPKAARRTIAEWVILVLNLGLGIGVGFLHPSLPFPFVWHEMAMIQWGLFLALVGYLGAGITLLLRARRIAAVFAAVCALAWWCMIFHELVQGRLPDGSYHPGTWVYCGVVFLIGLVHVLIARWLWRLDDTEGS